MVAILAFSCHVAALVKLVLRLKLTFRLENSTLHHISLLERCLLPTHHLQQFSTVRMPPWKLLISITLA